MAKKYDFHREYVGPSGPHLSCLTKMTLTGTRRKPSESVSIHPLKTREGRSRFEKEMDNA